jgi:hypothetical protein
MNSIFEFLFSQGRILTIVCMIAIVAICLLVFHTVPTGNFRGPAAWLVLLNAYLLLKLLFYGINTEFFFEAGTIISLTTITMVLIFPGIELRSALQSDSHSTILIKSIWLYSLLLVSTNITALIMHPNSAVNFSGRMHGTTVNPQHLAMMCALAVPGVAYVIARAGPLSIVGIVSCAMVGGIIFIEYMTGSRMGFTAACLGFVVSLREYIAGRKWVAGICVGVLILVIVYLLYGQDIANLITERFIEGRVNTRAESWTHAWENFRENPIFGAEPDDETGRLMFIESFWLASLSTGGLVALALSVPIFVGLTMIALKIAWAIRSNLIHSSYGNFFLSALTVLLCVSLFEAALLGIVTTHTMIAYIYLATASRFVSSLERIQRMRRQVGVQIEGSS